jgi:hypothetical protein
MRIVYVISFFVFAIVGCESQSAYVEPLDDVIMPLALGNTWVYELTRFADDGSVGSVELDTTRIVKVTDYTGEVRYYTYFENDMGSYYTNKSDGLWSGSFSSAGSRSQLSVPYPAEIGDFTDLDTMIQYIWDSTMRDRLYDTVITRITLKEKNVGVEVKAGTYACYHYEMQMKRGYSGLVVFNSDYYYAPNVGRILLETYAADLYKQLQLNSRYELLSPPHLN